MLHLTGIRSTIADSALDEYFRLTYRGVSFDLFEPSFPRPDCFSIQPSKEGIAQLVADAAPVLERWGITNYELVLEYCAQPSYLEKRPFERARKGLARMVEEERRTLTAQALRIPETWTYRIENERSHNELLPDDGLVLCPIDHYQLHARLYVVAGKDRYEIGTITGEELPLSGVLPRHYEVDEAKNTARIHNTPFPIRTTDPQLSVEEQVRFGIAYTALLPFARQWTRSRPEDAQAFLHAEFLLVEALAKNDSMDNKGWLSLWFYEDSVSFLECNEQYEIENEASVPKSA